jgi:hypothetical protein
MRRFVLFRESFGARARPRVAFNPDLGKRSAQDDKRLKLAS